jgi:perosamine synthetase
MTIHRITSAGPSITQAEIDLVTKAITDGWQDKMNWYIDQFVKEFSDYIGIKYCLPTAHCTDAIHLAMLALDIGPGDEVIVPDLTWVA